uniref:Uncharacterized protein n=1 Tax=Rhizophora mucronata TaxID=61149 RepID=A0A2P2Q0Z3_RHIMU
MHRLRSLSHLPWHMGQDIKLRNRTEVGFISLWVTVSVQR